MTLLLHIGYHKTGSTWLQRRLFAAESSGFEWRGRGYEARRKIVWPASFDYSPDAVREYYKPQIERTLEAGKMPLFSDERFSGNPHSGGFDSKELADRLRQVTSVLVGGHFVS